jgi:predicted RNA polymerase sigma factor
MARLLLAHAPEEPEVIGLLALLRLTDARRAARTGASGELVPLDAQDRTRWDRAAIEEGLALVERAMRTGRPGAYSIQAAIAALHDEAASSETTDWPQILGLYDVLLHLERSPMAELSRVVALAMVEGPHAGLAALRPMEGDARLGHRLDAVRGHLLERAGDRAGAVAAYRRAAGATTSHAERDHLWLRAAILERER